jgi:hypothetical protein
MKKLLAIFVLAVLAAAAYAAYVFVIRSPEKQACLRLADLCGFDPKGGDTQQCLKTLDSLKTSNAAAVTDFTTCTGEAKSCAGALGCASGAVLGLGTSVVKDFLSGFGKSAK